MDVVTDTPTKLAANQQIQLYFLKLLAKEKEEQNVHFAPPFVAYCWLRSIRTSLLNGAVASSCDQDIVSRKGIAYR